MRFPEETSRKIAYTSLMTILEKKVFTKPLPSFKEWPMGAKNDVDKMFIKAEWIHGKFGVFFFA